MIWKNTVLLCMLYLRPQSRVFWGACDCISPSYWNHQSADCNPLIFGPHFFGVYFICLFINSPKPVLVPISSFSLKATGFSCLGYLSPEEKRLEGHTALRKKEKTLRATLLRGSVLYDRTGWLTLHRQQSTYLGNIIHDGDFKFPVHERAIRVGYFII